MRVAVCIATYGRQTQLQGLLISLTSIKHDGLDVVIIVVDNDQSGSAQSVVEAFRPHIRELIYVIEPVRGISSARNRLVREALSTQCEYVAFVDDDEVVDPLWLTELATVAAHLGADVVTGPVIPVYGRDTPSWVVASKFFERPRYPTGTRLSTARTGNVLIKSEWVAKGEGPFRADLGLTGGEDAEFFGRIHKEGALIVWADEAVVHEMVPSSRARLGWILQRAYRGGNIYAALEAQIGLVRGGIRLTKGVAHVLIGFLVLLPSAFLGTQSAVRCLCRIAKGLGTMTGVMGYRYEEYR